MAEAIDSFNATKSAPTHNAVCPDFCLKQVCFIWHAWQVSELWSLVLMSFLPALSLPSPQNTTNIDTKQLWIWQCIGMSRGMCTFLCFCWKYTKTWHGLVLSPPYLWINLASLERKICHNSTCQINKTLDKSWETSWTNNQSCTRDSRGIALKSRGPFWGGSSHLWTSEGWSDAWLLLESVVCVNESSESLSKSQAQGNSQYTIYWFILYFVSLHTHNTLFTIRS